MPQTVRGVMLARERSCDLGSSLAVMTLPPGLGMPEVSGGIEPGQSLRAVHNEFCTFSDEGLAV